jgi:hypothetical protein
VVALVAVRLKAAIWTPPPFTRIARRRPLVSDTACQRRWCTSPDWWRQTAGHAAVGATGGHGHGHIHGRDYDAGGCSVLPG